MTASPGPAGQSVVPPHPPLTRYYPRDENKRAFVRQVFDDAAEDYDRLESLMAIGSGRWYRRRTLRHAGLVSGMRMLDVAVGTGLLAREAIEIVGPTGRIIGLDPSAGMLAQAARMLPITLVLARAEELPFAPQTFDFLSMGFALRHVSDLGAMFRQFITVLKPGGIVSLLEITRPRRRISRAMMRMYVCQVVPGISKALRLFGKRRGEAATGGATREARSRLLWQYYSETITHCVEPQQVLQALSDAGFESPRRNIELGIFSQYTARKPTRGGPAQGSLS